MFHPLAMQEQAFYSIRNSKNKSTFFRLFGNALQIGILVNAFCFIPINSWAEGIRFEFEKGKRPLHSRKRSSSHASLKNKANSQLPSRRRGIRSALQFCQSQMCGPSTCSSVSDFGFYPVPPEESKDSIFFSFIICSNVPVQSDSIIKAFPKDQARPLEERHARSIQERSKTNTQFPLFLCPNSLTWEAFLKRHGGIPLEHFLVLEPLLEHFFELNLTGALPHYTKIQEALREYQILKTKGHLETSSHFVLSFLSRLSNFYTEALRSHQNRSFQDFVVPVKPYPKYASLLRASLEYELYLLESSSQDFVEEKTALTELLWDLDHLIVIYSIEGESQIKKIAQSLFKFHYQTLYPSLDGTIPLGLPKITQYYVKSEDPHWIMLSLLRARLSDFETLKTSYFLKSMQFRTIKFNAQWLQQAQEDGKRELVFLRSLHDEKHQPAIDRLTAVIKRIEEEIEELITFNAEKLRLKASSSLRQSRAYAKENPFRRITDLSQGNESNNPGRQVHFRLYH